MKFRTDINGLRAYAVLAVIIFHFNKQWLSGGFAGVDVFFVISGYLMTSIIFRGFENNNFSIWRFYAARIRRIIPALLALIVILMIFGYLFLAPIPYSDLAKHSGGSLLFISNIMYWQESGYFDAAAIEKFLLHTWSLSVEWQFYMIYPLGLLILSKILKVETLKRLVVIGTVLSLIFAIYASQRWSVASYFLLPARIWEMLLGGIAFLYPFELKKQSEKHILELSGLALIVVSFFIINENISWPGYAALVPTLGAFILLQANNEKSLFTNNPIAQKIGLWSYSLYLYHWPLLAIYNYFGYKVKIWPFLFVTLACGLISYYVIEKRKWNVWLVIGATLMVLASVFGIYKTNGVALRFNDDLALNKEDFKRKFYAPDQYEVDPSGSIVFLNSQNNNADFILSGDSYALQYLKFFENINIPIISAGHYSCLVIPNYITSNSETCRNTYIQLEEILNLNKSAGLIISQNWLAYNGAVTDLDNNAPTQDYESLLIESLKSLISIGGSDRNYYLLGRYQYPATDSMQCLMQEKIPLGYLKSKCPEYQDLSDAPFNHKLKELASQYNNVYFIDLNNAICHDNKCQMIIDDNPVHFDNNHLSIFGADIIGKYIFDEIKKIEKSK